MTTRLVELLNAYGTAKFGDEWWPGNPEPWLPAAQAAELKDLLGDTTHEVVLHLNVTVPANHFPARYDEDELTEIVRQYLYDTQQSWTDQVVLTEVVR